jgi:hypothetical protein
VPDAANARACVVGWASVQERPDLDASHPRDVDDGSAVDEAVSPAIELSRSCDAVAGLAIVGFAR